MSSSIWIDIKKGKVMLVFCDFVARNLTRYDFGENTGHLVATNGEHLQTNGAVWNCNFGYFTNRFSQ